MKQIQLNRGLVALVDDADLSRVDDRKWYARKQKDGRLYVVDNRNNVLHRIIMRAGPGQEVDHKNNNGLDNQRENLRLCTKKLNMGNAKINKRNQSGFRGVHWCSAQSCWRAQCSHKHLGNFTTAEDAARAYDRAAVAEFGEFAKPNFPTETK